MSDLEDTLDILCEYTVPDYIRDLHTFQISVLYDTNQTKCLLVGRQSGKTHIGALWLLGGNPGQVSLYLAETIKDAWGIIGQVFEDLNEKYDLGLKIQRGKSQIVEANGHVIIIGGVKDLGQANRFRGKKFRKIFVDEASLYDPEVLQTLHESVLPATLFKSGGEIMYAGTPDVSSDGSYWFQMTGDPYSGIPGRYKTYHGTLFDNPHINPKKVIRELMKTFGSEDHPTYQREFLARYVVDKDAIVYPWISGIQHFPIPKIGYTGIALDFGFKPDKTAFTVIRQEKEPLVHVLRAYKIGELTPHRIGIELTKLIKEFNPNYIVADEGALGKGYAAELTEHFNIFVEPAPKPGKFSRIQAVRGAIQADNLVIHPGCEELLGEWAKLTWDLKKRDHASKRPDDLSDSFGYNFARMRQAPKEEKEIETRSPEEIERERRKDSARRFAEMKLNGSSGLW